ncbi:small-conductance mechanosensitive channel [Sporosarcina luteola]|nr:small-conductance mechanosensitive channel [Sporosarcina luteola]
MNWILILLAGIFLLTVSLIAFLLFSLTKQGDERKNYIKQKAMSQTFVVIIGVLLIEIAVSVYTSLTDNPGTTGLNPFTFLVTITIVYFVSLIINKKRFGG